MSLVVKPSQRVFWVALIAGVIVLVKATIESMGGAPPLERRSFTLAATVDGAHVMYDDDDIRHGMMDRRSVPIVTYHAVRVIEYGPEVFPVVESASLRVYADWHMSLGEHSERAFRDTLDAEVARVPGFEQIATPMRQVQRVSWEKVGAVLWEILRTLLFVALPLAVAMTLAWIVGALDAAVERLLRPKPIPEGICVGCGYDLAGLPGAVCPECGQDQAAALRAVTAR
ncbi:MAG: hypothetical protein AAF356_09315 [Planctomycetota bacterium]